MRVLNGGYDGPERRKSERTPQDSFAAIADWTAALHGQGSLEDALAQIVRLFGAEAGLAVRQVPGTGRQRKFAQTEIAHSRMDEDEPRDSVIRDALGADIAALRVGAVWMLSETRQDLGFENRQLVEQRMRALNLVDVAMFVLGSNRGQVDYVELFFCHAFRRADRFTLEAMAPVLARAWGTRQAGTVEVLISRRRHRPTDMPLDPTSDILGFENPAGLSRSEYRICALIREGLSAAMITEELSLSEATVRSHLRSIYAKTGTTGHVNLLHKLTAPRAPDAAPAITSLAEQLSPPVTRGTSARKYRPY